MATLTFRERVMDGRTALRRFFRLLSHPLFDGVHVAWVREYQGRGAVHYHVMWDQTLITGPLGVTLHNMVKMKSKGKTRTVIRGELERIIVEAWIAAVGDDSKEFIAFQWGGIVQAWEGQNGCARYFGSYLGKHDQKTVPEDAETSGRWWWVCKEAKPVPLGVGFLTGWHLPFPLSTLFDREPLMGAVVPNLPQFVPRWGDKPQFKWKQ